MMKTRFWKIVLYIGIGVLVLACISFYRQRQKPIDTQQQKTQVDENTSSFNGPKASPQIQGPSTPPPTE